MIRPFTCLCMLLAGGAGLYLYQAKHTSQLLDREITRTVRQAEAARERAGVLQAEYALLKDPTRLADLAGQHLPELKNTAPTQFTNWAEFEKRLPPVGAPAAAAPPLEPEAPEAKLPEPKPEPKPDASKPNSLKSEAGRPDPAKAEPTKAEPAKAEPAKAEPPKPVAAARPAVVATAAPPRPAPAPRPAQTQAQAPAQAAPPRPAGTPVSLTAALQPPAAHPPATPAPVPAAPPATTLAARSAPPPPPHALPAATPAAYTPPPGSAGEAVARIVRGGAVDPAVPAVASALGMARSMAAPPPVAQASAATIWRPAASPGVP